MWRVASKRLPKKNEIGCRFFLLYLSHCDKLLIMNNANTQTADTNNAICRHCGAFNAGFGHGSTRCGCSKAREERGEVSTPAINPDSITLVF